MRSDRALRLLLGCLLLAAGAALPRAARGQSVDCRSAALSQAQLDGFTDSTFDLQILRPALDAGGFFGVSSPRALGHLRLSADLSTTWAFRPLRMEIGGSPCAGFDRGRVFEVQHLVTTQLQLALGLGRRAQLGASVPVGYERGQRQICDKDLQDCGGFGPVPGGRDDLGFSGAAVGDLGLHGKVQLSFQDLGRGVLGSALALSLYLPVSAWSDGAAGSSAFLRENYVTLRPQVLLERVWDRGGRVRTALNFGALVRFGRVTFTDNGKPQVVKGDAVFCYPTDDAALRKPGEACGTGLSRTLATQLSYGLALGVVAIPRRLELVGEIYGLADATGSYRGYPAEGLGGVRIYPTDSIVLAAGGGAGLANLTAAGRQTGASQWRVFLSLGFLGPLGSAPPAPAAAPAPPRGPADRDGDGIPDDRDRCPNEPEDKDGFEDDDGCPDPDNDKDGILDKNDRCPDEPEDKDGFEDDDGCPDPDNDRDGILDKNDRCPNDPEDRDGFEDDDGCPDPDNDRDGIPDGEDKCPTKAGPRANQGCPDTDRDGDWIVDRLDQCPDQVGVPPSGCPERKFIVVTKEKIELKQQIRFATNKAKIVKESYPLLDEVFEVMKAQPALRLRIEGHTDNKGKAAKNKVLSQSRARAVVDYLVGAGIDAGRLSSEGFGPDRPIADNKTPKGREQNRRTEFMIVH